MQMLGRIIEEITTQREHKREGQAFFETSLMIMNISLSSMKLLFSIQLFFQENKKTNRSQEK